MTLRAKQTVTEDKFEETTCDRCGKSLMSSGVCPDVHYAVLRPSFGYESGLDMIQEGHNGMNLYFCESCYKMVLKLLGLEIGCNPQQGYHWKEPDTKVEFVVGDPTKTDDGSTGNASVPTMATVTMWPHLDKGVDSSWP